MRSRTLFLSVISLVIVAGAAWGQDSTLHVAARDGDVETVRRGLAAGLDPNLVLEEWSPLMFAAMNGEVEIARLLLDAGAYVDYTTGDYGPALAVAAMSPIEPKGDPTAMVQLLIERGASTEVGNGADMTPLMYAAREGKPDVVRYLILSGADADHRDARAWTPLRFAVQASDTAIARMLLNAGADPNVADGTMLGTPLAIALERGYLDMARLLLDNGAAPDGVNGSNYAPPVIIAANGEQPAALALLLDRGAIVNRSDNGFYEESPRTTIDILRTKKGKGWRELEKRVAKMGGMTQREYDRHARDLVVTALNGSVAQMRRLLEKPFPLSAATDSVGGTWYTPLSAAASRSDLQVFSLLLEGRSLSVPEIDEIVTNVTGGGRAAIVAALARRYPVETANAAIWSSDVADLSTALRTATPSGSRELCCLLHVAAAQGTPEMIDTLLANGADINGTNDWGETPLYWGARSNDPTILQHLLARGAAIAGSNRYGLTPLHAAARVGNVESVRALVAAGAALDARDRDGWTPLHHAAWQGDDATVEALLEAGADPTARSRRGDSPADVARQYGRGELVLRLER